jgi:hypothetical protein
MAALGIFREIGAVLEANKGALEGLQTVLTIVALVVGGWWTYRAFVRGRESYPSCDMALQITDRILDAGIRLLHVKVSLHNHGHVLARLETASGFVRVQQVLPLVVDLETQKVALSDNKALPAIEWPLLVEAEFPKESLCEIEPGETETFDVDLLTPDAAQAVRIHAHCRNSRKRLRFDWSKQGLRITKQIGWRVSAFYEIKPTEPPAVAKPSASLEVRNDGAEASR